MNYYHREQFIAVIDRNDSIIGKIEKWEAHKKAILHRGFTAILFCQDQIILQHRKHPVFDGCFDITFSSHQIYKNNILQGDLEAVCQSLKREWDIEANDLMERPKLLGKLYYKAKDVKSKFYEHEIDYIFSVILKKIPKPNLDYAYGFSLIKTEQLINNSYLSKKNFAPWAKKIINRLRQ
jgi:isopentenyl-diphosphate delta-isomerase